MAITLHNSRRRRIDTLANVFAVPMSRCDRRLIETATMLVPAVVIERGDILPCRDGRPSRQRRMGPVRVIEGLKVTQFLFQVRRGPEQHPIHELSSHCADQSFDKRMRQRHVRDTLHLGHPQDPQVGVPLVDPVQRVVVGAEARRT